MGKFVKNMTTRNYNDILLALKHRGGKLISCREINGIYHARIEYTE